VKEIIGFHGTKLENVNSIILDNFKIAEIKKTDNHWLGHGIYFFNDYELAKWWADTKVTSHIKKYARKSIASVVRAKIKVENIMDLDNPFVMNRLEQYCQELEEEIVAQGIILNFVMGDNSKKGLILAKQRKRCFWLDKIKQDKNIDVFIYTFTKNDPSYAISKYHVSAIKELGFNYNEKQICVSKVEFIVERSSIDENSVREVIIV